jgi:broad specificity phosphatase PhoE/ribonuclease HI
VSRRLVVEADGGARGNPGPAGYGAVVRDADTGEVLDEVAEGIGVATNNVAEYRGLIAGLRAASRFAPSQVDVRMDSKLVVQQMSGNWRVKHEGLRPLAVEAASLVRGLSNVTFRHIPREVNTHADRLANEAMDAAAQGRTWVRSAVAAPVVRVSGPPTVIWLVRHGESVFSSQRRFSGWSDTPLTEQGAAQAKEAGRRLASVGATVLVSSPQSRALRTASIVGEQLGLTPQVDPDLRETRFGQWEGLTRDEVAQRWPTQLAAWESDPRAVPPGGESFRQTVDRVMAAAARWREAHPGEALIVCTHANPVKVLVQQALGAPDTAFHHLQIAPGSITCVDWYPDGSGRVRLANDTCHLPSGAVR